MSYYEQETDVNQMWLRLTNQITTWCVIGCFTSAFATLLLLEEINAPIVLLCCAILSGVSVYFMFHKGYQLHKLEKELVLIKNKRHEYASDEVKYADEFYQAARNYVNHMFSSHVIPNEIMKFKVKYGNNEYNIIISVK